jgi:hypothetical protein
MFMMGMLLGLFSGSAAAHDSVEGKWAGQLRPDNRINLSHTVRSKLSNKRFHDSSTMPLDNLSGLASANSSTSSAVQFELRRDSGTIYYTGSFGGGGGQGDFRFLPNADFAQEMGAMGYKDLSVDHFFMMAVHDVNREFINQIKAFGYNDVTVDQLFSMRIHHVTPDFIQSLKDAGYSNVTVDNLISMRIHGADVEYIREVKSLGYDNLSGDQIISMRIHKVTVPYIKEMRSLGYNDLSAGDLVRLRIHRVTTEFVDQLNKSGQTGLSANELIRLRRQSRRTGATEKEK